MSCRTVWIRTRRGCGRRQSGPRQAADGIPRVFREHAEHRLGHFDDYRDVDPLLILPTHLHRMMNGGGRGPQVRPGKMCHGHPRAVAARAWTAAGLVATVRDQVQSAARLGPQESGGEDRTGHGADGGLHGKEWRRGGSSGDVRAAPRVGGAVRARQGEANDGMTAVKWSFGCQRCRRQMYSNGCKTTHANTL